MPRHFTVITDEQAQQIRDLSAGGKPVKEIYKELGVPYAVAYRIAHYKSFNLPRKYNELKKVYDDEIAEMNDLRCRGYPVKKIAEIMNVSIWTVYYYTNDEEFQKARRESMKESHRKHGSYTTKEHVKKITKHYLLKKKKAMEEMENG